MSAPGSKPCECRGEPELLGAEWCETHQCFWRPFEDGQDKTKCPMALLEEKFVSALDVIHDIEMSTSDNVIRLGWGPDLRERVRKARIEWRRRNPPLPSSEIFL